MPMVTGAYSTLISRDYQKYFWDEYTRAPTEWSLIAKMDPIDGAYEKESEAAGVTKLLEHAEGAAITYEEFKQGSSKEFNPKNFNLGIQVTRNMIDDDKSGIMKKLNSDLGYAARAAQEIEFWDVVNNGTVTTNRAGIDAKALFSNSHATIKGGGTIDNLGTAAALSTTSLQAMYNHFEDMVNEVNQAAPMKPKWLLIPSGLQWKAQELLLSEYNPENANMQYSTTGHMGLQYVIIHWLTDTNAWTVLSDKHDLRFRWRRPLEYKSYDDFNTDNVLVKATTRFVADFANYRGSYHNIGA